MYYVSSKMDCPTDVGTTSTMPRCVADMCPLDLSDQALHEEVRGLFHQLGNCFIIKMKALYLEFWKRS